MTCVVCGQLRPDLDLTLDDDDDEDLAAALSTSAGGGSSSGGGSGTAAPEAEPPSHVLRVASPVSSTIDSPRVPGGNGMSQMDQPYLAMGEMRRPSMYGDGGVAAEAPERLMDRIGGVLLIVCPLAVGMAGGLSMLARTDDFSTGTWYAVGAVIVIMLVATLFLGLAVTGLMFLLRVRWRFLIRVIFVAVAVVVCSYGLRLIPGHIQVRQDDLPGFVLRP